MSAAATPTLRTATRTHRDRKVGLVLACLGMMMTFLNITATASVLQAIQQDLQASSVEFVWMASIYTMVVASLVLSAGTVGDLLGRKRVFSLGVFALGAGSLTAVFAATPAAVIIGQAVMGVGGALVLPNSLAIVTHAFTDAHERTMAVGAWTAVSGVGLAIGPLVAGLLLGAWSWHAVFLVNVAFAVVVLALTPRFVQDSRQAARKLDPPGLILAVLAIATLNYAVITGGSDGFGAPRIVAAFALAALAGATFIAVELRRDAPMLNLKLFRSGSFSAANSVGFVGQFGFVTIALAEILWFERVERLSVLDTGIRLLPLMAAYVLVSARAAHVARRIGFKVTIAAGLALVVIGALLAHTQTTATPYAGTAIMLALFGAAFGLVLPPTTAAAVISLHHAEGGMASATVNMFRQVGGALGASITGTILTSGQSSVGALHVAVLVPAVAAALAAIAALWLIDNRPANAAPTTMREVEPGARIAGTAVRRGARPAPATARVG